jgi:hypothetical protein
MNYEMFKFSLLLQLAEFKKSAAEENFTSKNFDDWAEEFIRFLGYTVTDDEEEEGK